MRVLGGFAGLSQQGAGRDTRDTDMYETIVDTSGADATVVLTSAVTLGAGASGPSYLPITSATTLDGLTIRGSSGGALYSTDSFLSFRIVDCDVIGTHTRSEGAVRLTDLNVSIERCEFTNNKRLGSGGIGGGAVAVFGGSVRIEDTDFIGNSIWGYAGGAIRMLGGTHTVKRCDFFKNWAASGGGAISADVESVFISECDFFDNVTSDFFGKGGAVAVVTQTGYPQSGITDCLFVGNRSDTLGGAVYLMSASVQPQLMRVDRCVFRQNTADDAGGALSVSGQGEPVRVRHTSFRDNMSRYGGAAHVSIFALDCDFDSNTAAIEGGAVTGTAHTTFYNCNFIGNSANNAGGAVHVASAITLCSFEGNSANTGGAVSEALKFVSVIAVNKQAEAGSVGHNITEITDSEFYENSGDVLTGSLCSLESTSIHDNKNANAVVYRGVGLDPIPLKIRDVSIRNNSGSAVLATGLVEDCSVDIFNSTLADNGEYGVNASSDQQGDSIHVLLERCVVAGSGTGGLRLTPDSLDSGSTFSVIDSLIHTTTGPAIEIAGGSGALLVGCTLVNPTASTQPVALIGLNSTLLAESTILSSTPQATALELSVADALVVQCITAGEVVTGPLSTLDILGELIETSPMFVRPAGIDDDTSTWEDNEYQLMPGSPAIDRGAELTTIDSREYDLAGNTRMLDDKGMPDAGIGFAPIIDIGAYEFTGTTCAPDVNNDVSIDQRDFTAWINAYNTGDRRADQNFNGEIEFTDYSAWIAAYFKGCDF